MDHFHFIENWWYYDQKKLTFYAVQQWLSVEWKTHHHSVTDALNEAPHFILVGQGFSLVKETS